MSNIKGSTKATLNGGVAGWVSTPVQRDEAWKFCATAIERHYEEKLKRWNAELDMLLVFAGLFSTALTAFIVQSYPLLQPDNTDTVVLALSYLSTQIGSFTISQSYINSTQPLPFVPATDAPFRAPRYAVWINALWFSSLICTLSASSIAVLVKQWLYQYSQSVSGTTPEVARLRQYRYDSLLKWKVPEIIAALPTLLQVALALFLSGVLILLWTLHPSVAIVATLLVGVLLLFIITTTFLPIFYSDCCYQSTQALSLFLIAQGLAQSWNKILKTVAAFAHQATLETPSGTSRREIVLARVRDVSWSLLKIIGPMGTFRDWQTREKPDVEAKHSELEQSLALTAYYVTLDDSMLNTTVIPCLSGMDALSARMSLRYCDLLLDVTGKLSSREWKVWRPVMPFALVILSLVTKEPKKGTVRKVLQTMPRHPLSAVRSKLGMLYLLAMSQLVARRIAAREAFQRILVYLQHARIDIERSAIPGSSVMDNVEATFPMNREELEELIDLDKFDSVSYYLTGIEYTVKYLLHHRAKFERDGISVPSRIKALFRSLKVFLLSAAWRSHQSRQEVVLWALRYSQLPTLLLQLRRDPHGEELVENDVLIAFRRAVSAIERGYLTSGIDVEHPVSRGAKRAMMLIKDALGDLLDVPLSESSGQATNTAPLTVLDGTHTLATEVARTHSRSPVRLTVQTVPTQPDIQRISSPQIVASNSKDTAASADDASEILDTWIELLKSSGSDSPMFEEPTVAYEGVGEVPDSPLPDPHMWSATTSSPQPRRGRSRNKARIPRSDSFAVAGAQLLFETRPLPPLPPVPAPQMQRQQSILPLCDVSDTEEDGEEDSKREDQGSPSRSPTTRCTSARTGPPA